MSKSNSVKPTFSDLEELFLSKDLWDLNCSKDLHLVSGGFARKETTARGKPCFTFYDKNSAEIFRVKDKDEEVEIEIPSKGIFGVLKHTPLKESNSDIETFFKEANSFMKEMDKLLKQASANKTTSTSDVDNESEEGDYALEEDNARSESTDGDKNDPDQEEYDSDIEDDTNILLATKFPPLPFGLNAKNSNHQSKPAIAYGNHTITHRDTTSSIRRNDLASLEHGGDVDPIFTGLLSNAQPPVTNSTAPTNRYQNNSNSSANNSVPITAAPSSRWTRVYDAQEVPLQPNSSPFAQSLTQQSDVTTARSQHPLTAASVSTSNTFQPLLTTKQKLKLAAAEAGKNSQSHETRFASVTQSSIQQSDVTTARSQYPLTASSVSTQPLTTKQKLKLAAEQSNPQSKAQSLLLNPTASVEAASQEDLYEFQMQSNDFSHDKIYGMGNNNIASKHLTGNRKSAINPLLQKRKGTAGNNLDNSSSGDESSSENGNSAVLINRNSVHSGWVGNQTIPAHNTVSFRDPNHDNSPSDEDASYEHNHKNFVTTFDTLSSNQMNRLGSANRRGTEYGKQTAKVIQDRNSNGSQTHSK